MQHLVQAGLISKSVFRILPTRVLRTHQPQKLHVVQWRAEVRTEVENKGII